MEVRRTAIVRIAVSLFMVLATSLAPTFTVLVVVGLAGLNSGCVFVCAFVFCQPAAPLLQPPCVGSVLLHFIICFVVVCCVYLVG